MVIVNTQKCILLHNCLPVIKPSVILEEMHVTDMIDPFLLDLRIKYNPLQCNLI